MRLFPSLVVVVAAALVTAHPAFHSPADIQLPIITATTTTIYQTLRHDPDFSLLIKAIDYVEDLAALLDDPSAKITFFAAPDKALRCPHHFLPEDIYHGPHDLANLAYLIEAETSPHKPDDGKRKRFIKAILRAILSYHIIPAGSLDIASLGVNTTFPTKLTISGALASQPLRLRTERSLLPALTTVNLYSRITRPDVMATNGIIHAINHPLLPPPSIFQELFMVPKIFSTLTSAIQRTGLTDDLDLRYSRDVDGHNGHFEGSSAVTVFAPTNRAFDILPVKLRLFLFSPFGAHVLKKLLQFHIVPDLVLHSDYLYNSSSQRMTDIENEHPCFFLRRSVGQISSRSSDPVLAQEARDGGQSISESAPADLNIPRREPISSLKLSLDTLLTNHTLHAQIDKFNITFPIPGPRQLSRITTRFLIDQQRVLLPDVVGLNGAIHVVGRLLDPRKHPHHGVAESEGEDVWESWEQWLPRWGESAL